MSDEGQCQTGTKLQKCTFVPLANFFIEDEQGVRKRAAYGKSQLADLSRKLTNRFGRGWSETNLRQMRAFFLSYSPFDTCGEIQQRRSVESCIVLPDKEALRSLVRKQLGSEK